jgi:hypothetical protein
MKTFSKTVAKVLIVLLGLALIYSLALYSTAWYRRWRAERLLGAVSSLRMAVTTRVEYERAIQPFVSNADRIRSGDSDQLLPDAYGITTLPEWMFLSTVHLPLIFGDWAVIEGTVFSVVPSFKDGRLLAIRISETQGSGHPYGGFVTIHAGQVEHLFPDDTSAFPGYSSRPMESGDRVIYTHVDMDDRATPEERRRALGFRFDCFTAFRLCSDGRQLLDPITTDD